MNSVLGRHSKRQLRLLILGVGILGTLVGCGGGGLPDEYDDDRSGVLAATGPTIAIQPADTTVTVGEKAVFRVESEQRVVRYQWRKNNKAINGAVAQTYTTPRTTAGDDGDVYTVVVSDSNGKTVSRKALLAIEKQQSVLTGRWFRKAQQLEKGDDSVQNSVVAGIDDAGQVLILFEKQSDDGNTLYAIQGTPRSTSKSPAWSRPVQLAGPATQHWFFRVVVGPSGDAFAFWHPNERCDPLPDKCWVASYFNRATGKWQSISGDFFNGASTYPMISRMNSRGDIALLRWNDALRKYEISIKPGSSDSFTHYLPEQGLKPNDLGLDDKGNITVAGTIEQNSTTDAVVLRGKISGSFGKSKVVDKRGNAAGFLSLTVGTKGQAIYTFQQNNGKELAWYAATSTGPAAAWITQEMGPASLSGKHFYPDSIVVNDKGVGSVYDFSKCAYRTWSAGRWSSVLAQPEDCAQKYYTSRRTTTRNGDYIAVINSIYRSDQPFRWAAYDASRNRMIKSFSGVPKPRDFLYGFAGGPPYEELLLSVNGTGFIYVVRAYDVFPTEEEPFGDGRSVINLWGLYLK